MERHERARSARIRVAPLLLALVWIAAACAPPVGDPQSDSPSIDATQPERERGNEKGNRGEVKQIGELPFDPEEQDEFEKACLDAQGIPLEGADVCRGLIEGPPHWPSCNPTDGCAQVFGRYDNEGVLIGGFVVVSDGDPGTDTCDVTSDSGCQRFKVSTEFLTQLMAKTPVVEPSQHPSPSPSHSATSSPSPSSTASPTPSPAPTLNTQPSPTPSP